MKASKLVKSLEKMPELNITYAIGIIGGSLPLYEKIFKQVIKMLPSHIEQMEEYLLSDGDLGTFAIKVHGVKSSLRQIGHANLSRSAESLEKLAKAGNRQYCVEHFDGLKKELLYFLGQATEILDEIGTEIEESAQAVCVSDINDFYKTLIEAKDAIEDFDCMLTAQILQPLNKHRFGEKIDKLVLNAAESLEIFQAMKALDYITALLKICEEKN